MKNRDKLAYQAFAERFKIAVKRSGMTQAKIADLSGITEVSMSRYCNGDRLPGPFVIDRLCTVLGCSADWLIGRMEMPHAEVVYCTECKHYKEWDSEFVDNAVVTQCMEGNYPISKAIPDGWYCAGGVRK